MRLEPDGLSVDDDAVGGPGVELAVVGHFGDVQVPPLGYGVLHRMPSPGRRVRHHPCVDPRLSTEQLTPDHWGSHVQPPLAPHTPLSWHEAAELHRQPGIVPMAIVRPIRRVAKNIFL